MATSDRETPQPPQTQGGQPGQQGLMDPQPVSIREGYLSSRKLYGKAALITGGDSGIGRAVAIHFGREGADVGVVYLDEEQDALETQKLVEAEGARCLLIRGDVSDPAFCRTAVGEMIAEFERIDVLVNNAAVQFPADDISELTPEQIDLTFRTNVFAYLYLAQAAVPHMPPGSAIINTGSVTASKGNQRLVDYAATKGAIQSLTFSLAQQLADRRIRVNGVAPGPVWTPLIPATFPAEDVAKFGADTLLHRPAQPSEVAPAYVFLASEDASFITGQFIHINGGTYMH